MTGRGATCRAQIGRMFRRAEVREEGALLRDARAVNDKVRSLAKQGTVLINAKAGDADLDDAVATAVGWEKLSASVAEAERLARPDKADLPAAGRCPYPVPPGITVHPIQRHHIRSRLNSLASANPGRWRNCLMRFFFKRRMALEIFSTVDGASSCDLSLCGERMPSSSVLVRRGRSLHSPRT